MAKSNGTAASDQNTGSLEEFIILFNRYEKEISAFTLCDEQGYPWWDLVRYRVQFALCAELNIFGRPDVPRRSKLMRLLSAAKQAMWLLQDIARLRRRSMRQAGTLVISRRSIEYIDRVAGDEAESGSWVLFINQTGEACFPHMAISFGSIQFLTRLVQRAYRIPKRVERDARQIGDEIRMRFDSKLDIFEVITAKYREEMVARRVWSFILGQTSAVKRVIYVNDDTLKSMVMLARTRGIETEEVQHGYMGRGHIAFSYPPLECELKTLPDRLIISRDSGDIIYPVERVVVKTKAKQRPVAPRDIDVLIGSNPGRGSETADIVAALSGMGLRLAVKLHPAEAKKTAEVTSRFSPEEVVIYEGDKDFCDLAWRTRVFVPVNAHSTTAFEAADMGALVVLVDFNGVKKTAISDGVASARATSLRALPSVVRWQIAASKAQAARETGDGK